MSPKRADAGGFSRPQFDEYQRRFQTRGLDSLMDLPPIHEWHPQAAPQETADRESLSGR